MPIHHVQKMLMVSPDYSYKEKYWTILSNYVEENYGRDEIKSSILVQKILKECFTLLGEQFVNLIKSQNKASFYLYAHNFHENSGELWKQQLEGIKLSIDEEEFAGTRRVLKIILEQSCGIELVGTPNFNNEMYQNRFQYLKLLEELLYIGHWAIALSEYIARSQLFPKSIGISVVNHELNILTYSPYNLLYDFIHQDLKRHNDGVVINNTLKDFNVILKKSLGLDFHVIAAVVNEQLINSQYRHGVLQIEQLIDLISNDKGYDKDKLRDYYAGLTLTNYNFMSFENCILRNQDINRHTYRPILQMRIDNKEYCLIGRNKWLESLTLISTNAIPYGICATEWKKYKDIRKFIDNMSNNHDKILEKPLIELLEIHNYKYDNNIKTVYKDKRNSVNIEIKGIGEIDIMFLDEKYHLIYVCECKHNRSRFDMFNWRRDYSNFIDKYEIQLENKVNWVEENKNLVSQHFSVICDDTNIDLSTYDVVGIFAINAPTVYMHNGRFRTFTIVDFRKLLLHKFW